MPGGSALQGAKGYGRAKLSVFSNVFPSRREMIHSVRGCKEASFAVANRCSQDEGVKVSLCSLGWSPTCGGLPACLLSAKITRMCERVQASHSRAHLECAWCQMLCKCSPTEQEPQPSLVSSLTCVYVKSCFLPFLYLPCLFLLPHR